MKRTPQPLFSERRWNVFVTVLCLQGEAWALTSGEVKIVHISQGTQVSSSLESTGMERRPKTEDLVSATS